jgi:ribosomal protein S18 acetylase RimI-like enzyme
MKLFRHYKDKPYRFLGVAKHSETLEDMVIYKCRYDNPLGKLWVRPKGMFFENVKVGEKQVRRFAEIPLHIECRKFTSVNQGARILRESLGESTFKKLQITYEQLSKKHPLFHLVTGSVENKGVAYSLGYANDHKIFQLWTSHVSAKFQGLGFERDLLQAQLDACRKQGYVSAQTRIRAKDTQKIVVFLRAEFEITGILKGEDGVIDILLNNQL